MHNRPRFSTRPLSLLLVGALAAFGLWLFQPWPHAQTAAGKATDSAPQSYLQVDGQVHVESDADVVRHLTVPVMLTGNDSLSLEGAVLHAETEMSPTAAAAVPASYALRHSDGSAGTKIASGEHVELLVDLPDHTSVHPANPLSLVFKTVDDSTLRIDDVLP